MEIQANLEMIQDIAYDILKEFDRICRKYDIKYTLEGGSLIGAVKYKNFVPWDDDVDVVMIRDEYNKFLKLAPGELSNDYFLQSYNNIKEFPLNYAKLCYTKSKNLEYSYSHIEQMNHGIFIDIFPVDNVIPSKMKKQIHIIGLLTAARRTKLKIKIGKASLFKKIMYKSFSLLPLKFLRYMTNKMCNKYNADITEYRYEVCNSNSKFSPMPAQMYDNVIELPFRDRQFFVVSEYDMFLKSRFGDNYMNELPPEEARKPSHNPNIIIYKDAEK